MFQNAKNNKALHHVADTIQSLVEIGIRPVSIHFNESKPKVMLQQPPTANHLGSSYRYSWGKDDKGRFYELHMLPMRDINLVWRTYPTVKSTIASRQSPNMRAHAWDIAPTLRPQANVQPSNDVFFSIPA